MLRILHFGYWLIVTLVSVQKSQCLQDGREEVLLPQQYQEFVNENNLTDNQLNTVIKGQEEEHFNLLLLAGPYKREFSFKVQPTARDLLNLLNQNPPKFEGVSFKNPIFFEILNQEYEEFRQIQNWDQLIQNQSKVIAKEQEIEQPIWAESAESCLRKQLLQDYDKEIWPWSNEGKAVPVKLNIHFFRVLEVDSLEGFISLMVWFRLTWWDPRLVWQPSKWNNMSKMWFEDMEYNLGELWTPRIELWNGYEGLSLNLYPQQFQVGNDGTVFWSRYGQIKVAYNIVGQNNFPYDYIECLVEFGSWIYDRDQIILDIYAGGYTLGGSIIPNQSPYQQYEFYNIIASTYSYPAFDGYQEVLRWPVVLYNVVIRRRYLLYTIKIALPQGFITLVGFAAFWLSPGCGERMKLAITIPVANAVYDLLVFEQLPDSTHMVFASMFGLVNFMFSMLVVVETVCVIMLWEKQDPYLGTVLASIKKSMTDFKDQRDWVIITTAADEYLVELSILPDKNGIQKIFIPQRKFSKFKQWKNALAKTIKKQLSRRISFRSSSSKKLQQQLSPQQQELSKNQSVWVTNENEAKIIHKQLSKGDSIDSLSSQKQKFQSTWYQESPFSQKQQQQSPQQLSEVQPQSEIQQCQQNNDCFERNKSIWSIADLQTIEDVTQFFQDLVQFQKVFKENKKFEESLNNLVQRYGEHSVQKRIVSHLAQNDEEEDDDFMGVNLKNFRQEAAKEYNQKWKMIAIIIDRVSQILFLAAYVAYVLYTFINITSQVTEQKNNTYVEPQLQETFLSYTKMQDNETEM